MTGAKRLEAWLWISCFWQSTREVKTAKLSNTFCSVTIICGTLRRFSTKYPGSALFGQIFIQPNEVKCIVDSSMVFYDASFFRMENSKKGHKRKERIYKSWEFWLRMAVASVEIEESKQNPEGNEKYRSQLQSVCTDSAMMLFPFIKNRNTTMNMKVVQHYHHHQQYHRKVKRRNKKMNNPKRKNLKERYLSRVATHW